MWTSNQLGAALLLLALAFPAGAREWNTVWVFTGAGIPPIRHLEHANRVFVLDEVEEPMKGLAFPHPGSVAVARQQAMRILQSPQGRAVMENMRRSATAVATAWQHGIEKLPAILVDDTYVVYGVYDVTLALEKIAAYRHAR